MNTWRNKAGQIHRDGDLPAIVSSNGSQWWYKNDQPHRDGDLPATIWATGQQWWYKDGKLHRINGPAKIWDNSYKEWSINLMISY